ncbi:MAG: DUF2252 family protein [Calditrichaeota bacterium]|nr:DUF2252 family protein [Calditrichota bacterium]MCB0269901.1 DUF2252 family protein [Calditrichota bacterium]
MSKFRKTRWQMIIAVCWITFFAIQSAAGKDDAQTADKPDVPENRLYIDPQSRDFAANPELLDRILKDPHGYFRFINVLFSEEVCRRFSTKLPNSPSLNLHGDAHIEQYAITDLGRGLTDFDDASSGPGYLDLLRFGVSLNLTCQLNNYPDSAKIAFNEFLRGYRDALKDPAFEVPECALVQNIRSKFFIDREAYFKWVATVADTMPEAEKDTLKHALQPYVDMQLLENQSLTPEYFSIVSLGYLKMGIGSALDIKYLARIKGKTDDPMDDVVLELKEVRDLSGISCINTQHTTDPFRILVGQTRIAYQPFKHLGYFRFHGRTFWVHSWVDNYKEVNVNKSFHNFSDLRDVAYDVGIQLGKGHVKHIAAPLDLQLRREQQLLVQKNQKLLWQTCVNLSEEATKAWEMFRDQVANQQ